jgi:putative membrane protein
VSEDKPRRLHPGTIIVRFLKDAPQQVIGAPALLAFFSDAGIKRALFYILAFAAISISFRAIAWWRFSYTVLPNELTIESGIFSRNKRSIPWDRVQDVDIERDMFARIFGWAKVKLETGGSGKDEGALDSIAIADAEALRDLVRSRRSGVLVAQDAADASASTPPAFAMPMVRLMQAGFFNFSVVWMALLFGALQTVDDWLPFGWNDLKRWLGVNEKSIGGFFRFDVLLAALSLFLLLGVVSGIIQMIVTNFGFRLSVEGNGLRRVRGLFTRSEIVIPRKRIQLATVTRRWIARRFGFAHVAVQTLGGGSGTAGGVQDLAPLANAEETAKMLALAGDFTEPDQVGYHRVATAHVWMGVFTNSVLVAVVVLVASLFETAALWALPLVSLAALLSWLSQRPHAWVLGNGILAVRRGWFSQKQVFLPIRNIQSLSIERGPLHRLAGLAGLFIDTAGGSHFGVRISNLRHETARKLVRDLRHLA